ncbi:unnamed protein product, partial [Medioppia subpectinata]
NEKTGRIQNAPYVDNSYKWAGGGLLSNVEDLLKFGNIMLYSFKGGAPDGKPGLINKDIVDMMWTPAENTLGKFGAGYGLGWGTLRDGKCEYAFCAEPMFPTLISHTGGAIGASSILMIEPNSELIVAVIVNTTGVSGLGETATYIAHQFTRHNNWTQKLSQILSESINTRLDWDRRWGGYGLGWGVIRDVTAKNAFCAEPLAPNMFSHVGAAVGSSSVILIEPNSELIVTIITNLQNVNTIYNIAVDIAQQFTQKQISIQ